MKQPSFLRSLQHAWDGVCYTLRTQRNARIHLMIGTVVLVAAVWLRVDPLGWGLLILAIGGVVAGETINTTVEAIVDLLEPEYHERAKLAKDVAAGAVLVLSLTAIGIGLVVLGPPLWKLLIP